MCQQLLSCVRLSFEASSSCHAGARCPLPALTSPAMVPAAPCPTLASHGERSLCLSALWVCFWFFVPPVFQLGISTQGREGWRAEGPRPEGAAAWSRNLRCPPSLDKVSHTHRSHPEPLPPRRAPSCLHTRGWARAAGGDRPKEEPEGLSAQHKATAPCHQRHGTGPGGSQSPVLTTGFSLLVPQGLPPRSCRQDGASAPGSRAPSPTPPVPQSCATCPCPSFLGRPSRW